MIFEAPIVCLVTSGNATDDTYSRARVEILENAERAADAGVDLIQIREKKISARLLQELCVEAAERLARSRTKLIVNDRVDVAMAARAHGVHLRGDSLPVDVVRRIAERPFIIGVSTHTTAEVEAARQSGADYAFFGPVFATTGKPNAAGLGALAEVCRAADGFPVLAIGGIEAGNVREVINAGASGFAAIRFLNGPSGLEFVRGMKNVR